MKDSAVWQWFKQQDDYAEKTFNNISGREKLLAEFDALDTLWSDFVFAVRKDGNDYLYLKRYRKEERTCLIKRKGEYGKEEVLIDFKKEFPKNNFDFFPVEYSPVSQYMAFHLREGNHEASTIYFYDVLNKRFFPEQVRYSFGGYPYLTKFTHDGKAFMYYSVNVENNKASTKHAKGMLHRIGTVPESDKILASRETNPELADFNENSEFEVSADPSHHYLILYGNRNDGDYTLIAPYHEIKNEKVKWRVLVKASDKLGKPIIRNGYAYFVSHNVPNQKVMRCRLGDLSSFTFETFLPEGGDKIDNISATKDYLLIRYTNGVKNWFKLYNTLTSTFEDAPIPSLGLIRTERISEGGNEILMNVTSWNKPSVAYLFNPKEKAFDKFSIRKAIDYPEDNNFIVKEIEVKGHDGVMIPLSIIYHKDTKLDGSAVCHLSGYGAYGTIASPTFAPEKLLLGRKGVIFASAHVRGGGEKGEAWRLGGYKETKPNTWKDFISCAEWLIKNRYTNANKLIAESISAGGILVGRAMTDRPDLFAVVINRVGINNVLRHEVHSQANVGEWGTIKDSMDSRYLYNMDVVQHIREGVKYPAVLATVGMTDGRISPFQPAKLVAALQHATASGKPILLQVYYQGGHFGETGKSKNTNVVNEWAFALWQAGHPDFKMNE